MEYFVRANTFAAPFVSDTVEGYTAGSSPAEALAEFVRKNPHYYAVVLYTNADAYHKSQGILASWLSEEAKKKWKIGPDGKYHTIKVKENDKQTTSER